MFTIKSFSFPTILLLSALFLSACHSSYQSRSDIQTYRNTQQISHDDAVVTWRKAQGIPLSASIAITAKGNVAILQEKTPAYVIGRTLDVYNREFAPCYLRRKAVIAAKHVTLEVPCRYRRDNDEENSLFNHDVSPPFPGADFDISTLENID